MWYTGRNVFKVNISVSFTALRMQIGTTFLEGNLGISIKMLRKHSFHLAIPLLGIYPKKGRICTEMLTENYDKREQHTAVKSKQKRR